MIGIVKIAICDDIKDFVNQMIDYIDEYKVLKAMHREINIQSFENGDSLIELIEQKERFDIIFLDILMPFINGIDVAKEIRKFDKNVKIIFLTSSPEFALDSYDVKAFSYILKQSSKEKIFQVLDEALSEIENTEKSYIMVKTKTGLVKVFYHNIEHIEIHSKTIIFHLCTNETYETFGSLSEIEDIFLSQSRFIKPYRSYIVNMDYVMKLSENKFITINNYHIPISRTSYSEVKRRYITYSFNCGENSNE